MGAMVLVLTVFLCGCQAFLYPLIDEKNAIEEPQVEGTHEWTVDGEKYEAVITKVHPGTYRAAVSSSLGKTELLLRLTKIKDQIFFQLSAYPKDFARPVDESGGEGMDWAMLESFTQRPTYLIGKIVSFKPHLRITFFNASEAAQKYFSEDMTDSYKPYSMASPTQTGRVGALIVFASDKLRAFVERAADDPSCFSDLDFAK